MNIRADKEHYIVFQKFLPNKRCIVYLFTYSFKKIALQPQITSKENKNTNTKKKNSSLWKFVYIYLKPSGYYKGHCNLMQI